MATTDGPTLSKIACRSACCAIAGRPRSSDRARAVQVLRRITSISLPVPEKYTSPETGNGTQEAEESFPHPLVRGEGARPLGGDRKGGASSVSRGVLLPDTIAPCDPRR